MKKLRTIRSLAWLRTGWVLPTVLAGCMNHHDGLVDKCATIPPAPYRSRSARMSTN